MYNSEQWQEPSGQLGSKELNDHFNKPKPPTMTPQLLQQIEDEAERYASEIDTKPSIHWTLRKQNFIAGATFALSLPRWIKIEEGCEMPEKRKEYNAISVEVLTKDAHGYAIAYYDYTFRKWHYYLEDVHGELKPPLKPTHWQPLPKLPQ